jgi:hypothetical protein
MTSRYNGKGTDRIISKENGGKGFIFRRNLGRDFKNFFPGDPILSSHFDGDSSLFEGN